MFRRGSAPPKPNLARGKVEEKVKSDLKASWQKLRGTQKYQGKFCIDQVENKKTTEKTIDEELLVRLVQGAQDVISSEVQMRDTAFDADLYIFFVIHYIRSSGLIIVFFLLSCTNCRIVESFCLSK